MQMCHMSMLWTVCACHDLDVVGYHDNLNKQIKRKIGWVLFNKERILNVDIKVDDTKTYV